MILLNLVLSDSNGHMKHTFWFTCLLISTTCFSAQQSLSHLHELNQHISSVKQHLQQFKLNQKRQQAKLQSLESRSADMALTLNQTNTQIKQLSNKLNQLDKNLANDKAQILKSRHQLADNIRNSYIINNQPRLAIVLSHDNIADIQRDLTYTRYLNQQQLGQINKLNSLVTSMQQTIEELHQKRAQNEKLKQAQQAQLHHIQDLQKERNILINNINSKIASQAHKLVQLESDKRELETAVKQLAHYPLLYNAIGQSFDHLKHHLSKPTKGKIIREFDSKIDESQLRWKGVLFEAPMNQPVYAVADGKVIFARWLQGYGLLTIIYHGHGYMTLYGRNHYLYKKTGDIVHAGDQIAAVGDSGGYQKPALYFAIRHNTIPVNPMSWFHT